MLLEDGYERVQDGLPYRMEKVPAKGPAPWDEPESWVLRCRSERGWKDLYRFTLESATRADFLMGNHFHLTHPGSSFADAPIATRPVPGGRLTLVGRDLKTWRTSLDGEVLEGVETLPSRSAYAEVIAGKFGLALPGEAIDRLWAGEPSVSRGNRPLTMR